jgi:hypothetical protein
MSVKSFKFVSPGVFINEIDNSFIPKSADVIGPVVIGRATRGLAMQPVTVESYSEFVNMFGDTVPGNGGGDVYRDGNYQAPMYGTYAAKAFLRANVAPLTYVRLLGQQVSNNTGTTAAKAGWQTTKSTNVALAENGGSFGLFIGNSGSTAATSMALAAIFYIDNGHIQLSGTVHAPDGVNSDRLYATSSTGQVIRSDTNGIFKMVIQGTSKGQEIIEFGLDDTKETFIRKRFNTNPQLGNANASDFYAAASERDYFLGETFEQELRDGAGQSLGDLTAKTSLVGTVLPLCLSSSVTTQPGQMKGQASREATAGWFIGQDQGAAASFEPQNMQKLFRLLGRGHGEWLHKNVKVSIERIKASTSTVTGYGTFSVVLRSLYDTDNAVVVVERFDNLTLDPTSPNYIARIIGDQYQQWNETQKRLRVYGDYPNQSKFVRVHMNADADNGATDPVLLPFGYFGPPRFKAVTPIEGPAGTTGTGGFITTLFAGSQPSGAVNQWGFNTPAAEPSTTRAGLMSSSVNITASLYFPSVRLRSSSLDGGMSDPTDAYFGMSTTRYSASTVHDPSVADVHNLMYSGFPDDPTTGVSTAVEGYGYVFSMDDIVSSSVNGDYGWVSGSRAAENSKTSASYKELLDAGYDRFTAPFWGGFDGLDIMKPDPLYNGSMTSAATERNSYVFHTYRRAIDTVADPEYINMNLLAAPGLTTDALTTHMVRVCEERGDAMALIDLANVYIPSHEAYKSNRAERIGTTPTQAATALKDRQIDSSYGATYYPWVQSRDEASGQLLWIPPSVAMMGVLASSERAAQLWFAPAGFNRGGLTEGAAGIPVSNVSERLTSKDRDTLYEARINPIASFPSSGIVVFGQKTLQERQSALDRINVRRLVIYLKKQISILSTKVLFEQNVQATWLRFKSLIEPLLSTVKTQFGITDYRLILDDTTTTPDLIDQNILYAKIMVKPARAIEFIAIDFVITSTGASFDD